MNNIINQVSGRKTYVVSAITALYGVLNLVQGQHWSQIVPFLLAGAFGGSIRAAVAKVEAKLPATVDSPINKATGL